MVASLAIMSDSKTKESVAHSNEVVMEHVLQTLHDGQFTGGVIRKHERRDIVTTASLLTNGDKHE
jgi:hypothetical protein